MIKQLTLALLCIVSATTFAATEATTATPAKKLTIFNDSPCSLFLSMTLFNRSTGIHPAPLIGYVHNNNSIVAQHDSEEVVSVTGTTVSCLEDRATTFMLGELTHEEEIQLQVTADKEGLVIKPNKNIRMYYFNSHKCKDVLLQATPNLPDATTKEVDGDLHFTAENIWLAMNTKFDVAVKVLAGAARKLIKEETVSCHVESTTRRIDLILKGTTEEDCTIEFQQLS